MSRLDGNLVVSGNLTVGSIALPNNSVGDPQFDASNPLTCQKQNHQYQKDYAQTKTTTVATDRQFVHMAFGDGEIVGFRACLIDTVCAGAATVTVKMYKNGADITGTTITIDNTTTLRQIIEGTVSPTTYVADNVFELVVTATAGGGTVGKGLCVTAIFREEAE
jgi:hypothetical protein